MKTKWIVILCLLAISVSASTESSEAYFLQAKAFEYQGKDTVASYYYGLAYQEDRRSLALGEIYGKSLMKVGMEKDGINILREVTKGMSRAEQWKKAEELGRYIYMTAKDPSDGNLLAYTYFLDGLKTKDPNKKWTARSLWNSLTSEAIKEGRLDDANITLTFFLQNMPEDANAWALQGAVYNMQEDYRTSLKCLVQAATMDSTNYLAWYTMGSSLERISQDMAPQDRQISLRAAVKSFNTALKIKPNDPLSIKYLNYIKELNQ